MRNAPQLLARGIKKLKTSPQQRSSWNDSVPHYLYPNSDATRSPSLAASAWLTFLLKRASPEFAHQQ
jgi:hypothetical protein